MKKEDREEQVKSWRTIKLVALAIVLLVLIACSPDPTKAVVLNQDQWVCTKTQWVQSSKGSGYATCIQYSMLR